MSAPLGDYGEESHLLSISREVNAQGNVRQRRFFLTSEFPSGFRRSVGSWPITALDC
jgi:hypothetical protein